METTVFNVAGLNDTNSGVDLKNAIISLPGVSNVAVDVYSSAVKITYDSKTTSLSAIRKTITNSGHYIQ